MPETFMIEIERTKESKLAAVDFDNIPFGQTFSDHMLVAEYYDNQWQSAKIMPYGPLQLSPATSSLHYGQAIFEGMKAHRTADGGIALFRPDQNYERFNRSARRMAMPQVPSEIFADGLIELLKLEKDWIPDKDGSSLYIRPLMFATEPHIGVKTSDRYLFIIMVGPAGPYYDHPISVKVVEDYARAVKGGVGNCKTAGNYGRTLYVVDKVREEGYKDVLWLDGVHKKYVEEIGTMNVFFVIDGKVTTPVIDGTFLDGVTRSSVLQIARDLGYETDERKIAVDELVEAHGAGRLTEMFGSGTAATITHISHFGFRGKDYAFDIAGSTIAASLKEELEGIKHHTIADRHNWLRFID
jgi:branched-chain amino acid aminotransferase